MADVEREGAEIARLTADARHIPSDEVLAFVHHNREALLAGTTAEEPESLRVVFGI